MAVQTRTVQQVFGGIGTSAHGVVTRAELLRAGVTPAEIEQRLRIGAATPGNRTAAATAMPAPCGDEIRRYTWSDVFEHTEQLLPSYRRFYGRDN